MKEDAPEHTPESREKFINSFTADNPLIVTCDWNTGHCCDGCHEDRILGYDYFTRATHPLSQHVFGDFCCKSYDRLVADLTAWDEIIDRYMTDLDDDLPPECDDDSCSFKIGG